MVRRFFGHFLLGGWRKFARKHNEAKERRLKHWQASDSKLMDLCQCLWLLCGASCPLIVLTLVHHTCRQDHCRLRRRCPTCIFNSVPFIVPNISAFITIAAHVCFTVIMGTTSIINTTMLMSVMNSIALISTVVDFVVLITITCTCCLYYCATSTFTITAAAAITITTTTTTTGAGVIMNIVVAVVIPAIVLVPIVVTSWST